MQNRKQQVIIAALNLFQKKGYAATSIQDIIEASNISKGTFYNYFSSKNEFSKALLEYADQEETWRRKELLIGKDKQNKEIFAKQILLRIEISREFNLLSIFEAIFHSEEVELKEYVERRFLVYLTWLRERFIDIYGKEAEDYANDGAIIFYSIIQNMARLSKAISTEKVDFPKLISFALRRMDTLFADMIKEKDHFLPTCAFAKAHVKTVPTKEEIISQIQQLINKPKNELQEQRNEILSFLITELSTEKPRFILIESTTKTLRTIAEKTTLQYDMRQLITNIFAYIEDRKN
ncbi:TetR/AcrR family transcriptional regulator [Ornithinibacillus sp. 4-3]|uniref:TetR/AcrR family transcriptional regulator n=1 Tax=Ornithinibacillus sp. 4-3 TaxID=3231488 RepID=A0AB39HRF4_9BACI